MILFTFIIFRCGQDSVNTYKDQILTRKRMIPSRIKNSDKLTKFKNK